jgi:hypothetical protein
MNHDLCRRYSSGTCTFRRVACPLSIDFSLTITQLNSTLCSIGKLRHAEHKYPVYIIVPLVRPPQPRNHELCACVRWGCVRKLLHVRKLRSSEQLVRDRWLADRSYQISKRPYNRLITLATAGSSGSRSPVRFSKVAAIAVRLLESNPTH